MSAFDSAMLMIEAKQVVELEQAGLGFAISVVARPRKDPKRDMRGWAKSQVRSV
jgi:hypothetical protein